jgi:outer membrane receptor protein involved in Fe transport
MITSSTSFNQEDPAPGETTTSGYTLFDLSAGGDLKTGNQMISIIFSATNLFDKKYRDHLSTLNEVGYYNPGRNISVTL